MNETVGLTTLSTQRTTDFARVRSRGGDAPWIAAAFVGVAALVWLAPTIIPLASRYWVTEQGAQGGIVFAIAVVAGALRFRQIERFARPGSAAVTIAALAVAIAVTVTARLVGELALQMVGAVIGIVALLYGLCGAAVVGRLWMPLLLLLASIPLPYFIEQALTARLKLAIAAWSVDLVRAVGLDAANSGNALYVDQYELLVDAACSGLNSIVSLAVVGLFYAFWRHRDDWAATIILALLVVPVAILCNVARVCLILITVHYFGDRPLATALHPAVGIVMFMVALGCVIGLGALIARRPGRIARTARR